MIQTPPWHDLKMASMKVAEYHEEKDTLAQRPVVDEEAKAEIRMKLEKNATIVNLSVGKIKPVTR